MWSICHIFLCISKLDRIAYQLHFCSDRYGGRGDTCGLYVASTSSLTTRLSYVSIPVTIFGTEMKVEGATMVSFNVQGCSGSFCLSYDLVVSFLMGSDVMAHLPRVIILDPWRKTIRVDVYQDLPPNFVRHDTVNLCRVGMWGWLLNTIRGCLHICSG